MVTIQPEIISKEKTVKQIILANRLLQSRYFSKAEFEKYKVLELKTIKNSYEAGLLISLLIAKLRFRRKFNSKRSKARLKCLYCSSKVKLTRFINTEYSKQRVICEECQLKKESQEQEQQELAESNMQRIAEDLAVDDKIEANHAAQDYDKEVERANEYDPVAHNLNSPQNKPEGLKC